ncbi:MAG: GspH/FimT family pseudopilin [Burkholderiales bacterium]
MLTSRPQSGVTLIELMIGLVIMALLIMIGLPNMSIWLNNSQIRTTGETMLAGLALARTEAVRRNQIVRFQMVSDLTSGCAISTGGRSWVVSLDDPTAACDAAPGEPAPGDPPPRILQVRSGDEGTTRAVPAATPAAVAYFNGLGRLTSPGGAINMTRIDISNPTGGACENADGSGGPMRCMRINISIGGEAKMCDPAVDPVANPTDPRICP